MAAVISGKMKMKIILVATIPTMTHGQRLVNRRITAMSIERLPHKYPICATVRIGWKIGTVLLRFGKYHLIWWQSTEYPYGLA